MWKLLEISQKSYFIYCNFNTNTQQVIFILYDLKEAWSQTLNLADVKRKVKLLNKRLELTEDNIKEALTGDAPHSAEVEDQPHGSDIGVDSCLLKLKYRVKDRFLNYEWNLRKQTVIEFQQTFVQPLLMAMLGCHQQVEILTENLRKKEIELQQYRYEKGPLNISTRSTKPFDFDGFNKKYDDCNKIAINFKELAKYIKETDSKNVPETLNTNLNVNKTENDIKPEEKQDEAPNSNATKMSPRERKRKAKELKMQHLEKHLKLRRQGLEYESSQSQTPSTGNSQSPDETETNPVKEKKPSPTNKVNDTKSNKTISPRKSTRCAPTKPKWQYISSEDKTDSENDDNLAKLRERKSTREAVNETKVSNTSSRKEDISTKKSPENNNVKETKKSAKLSYNNCQTKLEKSLESSNVFDFSTDTEDDKPLKEVRRLIQSKKSLEALKEKRPAFCNVPPVLETITVEVNSPSRRSKNLSHSPSAVVMDELSSQLSNIKKELESLEAMRLADLKQRMCKV